MDIGIIIRMWHRDEQDFDWRLAYFEACVLPRLQKQTVQDFEIAILCFPSDFQSFSSLDDRIHPFTLYNRNYDYRRDGGNFSLSRAQGLRHYETQVRLDSDDLVAPNFLETIINSKKPYVTFQPELFILDTLEVKQMNHRYHEKHPSMFLAAKNYDECIYNRVMFDFTDQPVDVYPEGYAWMTIHDRNVGTHRNS